MISKELIQQLRGIEKKATKGKWSFKRNGDYFDISPVYGLMSCKDNGESNDADYKLICALRNNAVALITAAEECERLREENAHIKNFQYDAEGRIKLVCPKCEEKRVY